MSSMIATRVSVQNALAQLPEKYREPVTLRDVEGQTYQEVAEGLELSVGTVKSQVSRDRKSTRLNSSHVAISYAVFWMKKKNSQIVTNNDKDDRSIHD